MTIEIPFEVGQEVCRASSDRTLKVDVVTDITYEVFIHVRDQETGEIHAVRPEFLYTMERAKEYATELLGRIDNVLASKVRASEEPLLVEEPLSREVS